MLYKLLLPKIILEGKTDERIYEKNYIAVFKCSVAAVKKKKGGGGGGGGGQDMMYNEDEYYGARAWVHGGYWLYLQS